MLEGFKENRKTVCVQGLGFVGAAMALVVANAKDSDNNLIYNVIGVDIPNEAGFAKVNSLNEGIFPFENNDEKLDEAIVNAHKNKNFFATTDVTAYNNADIVIVDINLDVFYSEDGSPYLDLSYFKDGMHALAANIKEGALVIVETTVPPGTCEKVVYPIFKEEYLKRGIDESNIFIAHSYERVMPGKDYYDSIVNYWRVFSGINDISADKCEAFLRTIISTDKYPLTRLEKTTSTELSKVLENSYRATTIAFMEEWGRFAEAIGVNLFEVIDAIRMRPTHNNMRQPGFGVGGYCLTKDPYFAGLAAKDLFGIEDLSFPFCEMAVETNKRMPLVSLDKIQEKLGGSLKEKRMLVMGVSYRQDVGDTRYSPTEVFVKEAQRRGAEIVCQDPIVKYWKELDVSVLNEITDYTGFDVIVFTVQHSQYKTIDFKNIIISENTLLFDSNKVLSDKQIEDINSRNDVDIAFIGR